MADTSGKEHPDEAARAERIRSARSDFVSSLSRRIQELRTCLNALEQDPGSPRQRDDLRRRVHALSAGARLLRFGSMATALAEVERTLERAAAVGELERAEIRAISETLDGLHALAWNEPTNEQRPTERPPVSGAIGETAHVPPTVLVVGSSGIADAITLPIEHAADNDIECERTEEPGAALDLARALAPDVAVIDADLQGAKELIEKLARDPLTEPMPLIVVGTWGTPEEAGSFIASGAARALSKPVSPHELRMACVELSTGRDENLYYRPLGETTVEELTQRIITEIKRGLPEALVSGKATPIALGDGSDILAAVWGAVARVRDLVTIKSNGGVRFSSRGPEGALPFAPWWGDQNAPERRSSPSRMGSDPPRKAEETRLDGRRIVVADDDPAVTWFIGGVLRSAGAEVREAHDGDRALELCFRLSPELVISDVLMPGLDGFALCRALKRDIALRDVPVILLSWKEDLLQRLRDLGADADGYMRKEASAATLLSRVHEMLKPRARIEARLKDSGEVRGRLDGVTPRTLLHVTSRVRPDARLRVRDASFLYELELRDGAPRSATRTTSDGSFQRGKDVFAAVLGVRAGRFVVTHADRGVRGTLEGDLESQLEAPLAHARAALKLLGGTRLLEVHRVSVAIDRVLAYLSATPEPARTLVNRLAHGASPRGLILGSEVAPAQLEAVLCDLATHGAITAVHGSSGADLLGPALAQELAAIRRGGVPSAPPDPASASSAVSTSAATSPAPTAPAVPESPDSVEPPTVVLAPAVAAEPAVVTAPPPTGAPPAVRAAPPEDRPTLQSTTDDLIAARPALESDAGTRVTLDSIPEPPSNGAAAAPAGNESIGVRWESSDEINVEQSASWSKDDQTPSSLAAAVIREISDRTPLPAPAPSPPTESAPPPSIVDMSELKARTLSAQQPHPVGAMPSLPPDAVVPGSSHSEERIAAAEPAIISNPPPGPDEAAPASPIPLVRAAASSAPSLQAASSGQIAASAPKTEEAAARARADAAVLEASREASARAWSNAAAVAESSGHAAPPARPVSDPPEIPKNEIAGGGSFGVGLIVALGALGVLMLGLHYGRSRIDEAAPTPVDPVATEAPFPELPASAMVPSPTVPPAALSIPPLPLPTGATSAIRPTGVLPDGGAAALVTPLASAAPSGEDLPLPPGVVVSPNQGLLDVEIAGKEAIFVDGVELGKGPSMRLVLAPGVHEVRQRVRGEWRIRFVLIRPARRTRLPLSSWTR
jgi:CheY-like chemotaxis protein